MDSKKSLTVFIVTCLLLSTAMVSSQHSVALASSQAKGDSITVPFSWILTDPSGRSAKAGLYDFTFALYDAKEGGKLLWSEQQNDVMINSGKVNVELGSVIPLPDTLLKDKTKLYWLAVSVRGSAELLFTELSPRQSIVLAPQSIEALSCPHNHFTDNFLGSDSGYGLLINNSGTGDGLRAYNNSRAYDYAAVYGENYANVASGSGGPGVYGYSQNGNGGTFYSGSYFGASINGGGDSSISDTVGDLMLNGDNGEIFANGINGMTLYSNYDIRIWLDKDNNTTNEWFRVFNGTGNDVFHVTQTGDIVAAGSKGGYVVDVAQNDDSISLETGDLVVVSGVGNPIVGEIPLIEVQLTKIEDTTAILGVVDKCFVTASEHETGTTNNPTGVSCENDTSIAPGEYLTVVTLGSFKAIKVDASFGAIQPGDLLVASANPGYAMVSHDPKVGTVIGKALEGLESGTGTIAVMIAFQ